MRLVFGSFGAKLLWNSENLPPIPYPVGPCETDPIPPGKFAVAGFQI